MNIGIRFAWLGAWLAITLILGCGTEIPPEPPAASNPPAPAAVEPPAVDEPTAAASEAAVSQDAAADQGALPETLAGPELAPPAQAAPAEAVVEPSVQMEQVKAERGVAAAGRSLDEHAGLLVTPAKAYFSVRERAVFDIQIPEALKLFKATNGNGPRSHDEFMAQVIEANQIQLPELADGQRYVYDPQTEQLMVERPAR
jgi:hypothetical protein